MGAAAPEATVVMPLPMPSRLPANSPTTSAIVDTTSKYRIARQPTRPALLTSPAEAMPCTMVRNTSGATPALISDRNMSPSSLSWEANRGNAKPTRMPRMSEISTCVPSLRYHGSRAVGARTAVAAAVEEELVAGLLMRRCFLLVA